MSQSEPIKVLIVTDNPQAMRESDPALADAEDIEIVREAHPGDDVATLATVFQPDVVIMDYDLPGMDTANATRAILREDSSIQVIMLSLVANANDIRAAMRAGARDYLTKPLDEGELVSTIRWLIGERREFAKTKAFISQMRRAFDTLFYDDKPVPENVIQMLVSEARKQPHDRLTQETLAVAYARNRDWEKLLPLARKLAETAIKDK